MENTTTENRKTWEAPDKRFIKTILSSSYGFCSPQDGSVCKLLILSDEEKILTDVNSEQIKELIVGDVDDPIEKLLESCVRTMKNEEICLLKFTDPLHVLPFNDKSCTPCEGYINPSDSSDQPTQIKSIAEVDNKYEDSECTKSLDINSKESNEIANDSEMECENSENVSEFASQDEQQSMTKNNDTGIVPSSDLADESSEILNSTLPKIYEIKLQLLSYTREPEIFEMSITEKWRRANYHKQKGMELYARGSYEWAFRRFGLALKYIISLEHDLPSGQEEGMNIPGLKLSCYLNVAACQMRHHNFESVVKNCTKALKIQDKNAKALYRRGAAYVQIQEYEKAKEDLNIAHELEPKNQAIIKQQQLLKAQVQKLNQYYANAMKKMFS